MMHSYDVLRRPVITEKNTLLVGLNKYTFEVAREANKAQIKEAVEMALRCGFEPRYRHGAGTQYFWLWYFRRWRYRQQALYFLRRAAQYFFMRKETSSRCR